MLGVLSVVVVFSLVILIHELGHFLSARRIGVRVERFCLGFGKLLWSRKIGDTEYALGSIPVGGYIKMSGEEPSDKHQGKPWEFSSQPPGKRFWILFAGAAVNYMFAFLIFSFILPTSRVGIVLEDMPAYQAGIKPNDRIVSINGEKTRYWYEVLDIVSGNISAKPLKMQIEREEKTLELTVTPKILESKDIFGREIKAAKVGIGYYGDVEVLKARPLRYLITGVRQTLDNTLLTYRFLWYLISGKIAVRGTVTGPVGIAVILAEAAKVGFIYLLYLVGHINLALAIFNLLPFPVLDGGHILFLGLEKIRGRPLSFKTQERIQYVAITLLIAFALFVTYNDLFMFKFLK